MICLCFDSHFNTPSKTLPLRRARQLGAPDSCWRPWECHFPGSRYSREAGRPWWSLLYHHGGEDLGYFKVIWGYLNIEYIFLLLSRHHLVWHQACEHQVTTSQLHSSKVTPNKRYVIKFPYIFCQNHFWIVKDICV